MFAPVSAALGVTSAADAGARSFYRVVRIAAVRCCLALVMWALPAQHVAAHGFPTPFQILFDADDPAHMAVLLRPGIAFTETGGESWRFLCGAVTGVAGVESYPAVLAGRQLLIGGFVGLYRDDGYGCDWSRVDDGLPGARILSLANVDHDTVEALVAATKEHPAGRYVSRDRGATWSPLAAALPTAEPRALARADALYLIGRRASSPDLGFWISDDDGETWTERSRLDASCDEILAIEPDTTHRVFLRCHEQAATQQLDAAGSDKSDRVLVSDDGGASFVPWIELPEIAGFALAPSGLGAWVGSRSGGLWLANPSGQLLSLHESLHVGCIQYWNETLWVCTRDERGYDPYAIAISRDGGHTLTPFLHSAEISALQSCGNPLQTRVCSNEWNQWQADVALTPAAVGGAPVTPPAIEDMSADAGARAITAPRATATHCAVYAPRGSRAPLLWAILWSFAWLQLTAARRKRGLRRSRPKSTMC